MLIQYLTKAASGNILGKVVWLVLLSNIPYFLLITLPIAVFLSILIVYGRVFHDSELLVAFTCGFNWMNLLRVTVFPVFWVAVLVGVLSFYVVPVTTGYRNSLLSKEITGADLSYITPETFTHIKSSNIWIYTPEYKDGALEDVFVFTNQRNQTELILAKKAYETKKNGQTNLVFSDGDRYTFPKNKDTGFRIINFSDFSTEFAEPKARVDRSLKLLTVNSLLSKKTKRSVVLEIYNRIAQPINVFIMMALGLMLCVVSRGQGRYGKLFLGVLIYIIYFNATAILENWAREGLINSFFGLFIVQIIIAVLFLFWMLKKQRVLLFNNKYKNKDNNKYESK